MSSISLTWVDDVFPAVKDAISETSPNETKLIRIANRVLQDMHSLDLEPAILQDSVYVVDEFTQYALPAGFRKLIDLRPIRYMVDRFRLLSPLRINSKKSGEWIALKRDKGILYAEIIHSGFNGRKTTVTGCNSLTADGAWSNGGGVSNIALDEETKKVGGGSINFDITSVTTGIINFTRTNVIDIDQWSEQTRVRMWVYFPTAPSSVALRWGPDASSNYYSHSVTTQAHGAALTTGWNILEFAQASATLTGTMDRENIDVFQLRITFSTSTTDTDFRIDHIVIYEPEELEMEHYSEYTSIEADDNTYQIGFDVAADCDDIPLIYNEWLDTFVAGIAWKYLKSNAIDDPDAIAAAKEEYYLGKEKIRRDSPSRRMRRKRALSGNLSQLRR